MRRRIRLSRKGKAFVFFLLALILFCVFDAKLRPVMREAVDNEAKRVSAETVNDAVTAILEETDCSELISYQMGSDGKTAGISVNTQTVGVLKEKIIKEVSERLRTVLRDTSVPLGTLFGSVWTYGRGPDIPISMSLTGNVEVEFESVFLSAGINQTKYSLYLSVHTQLHSFLSPAIEADTRLLAAETVIVGEVPEVVANFGS